MQRFRKILVGLDFDDEGQLSFGSRTAARHSLWLASKTGARVEFLHSTYNDAEDFRQLKSDALETNAKQAEQLVSEFGKDVDFAGLTVSDERPWLALTKKSLRGEADLVVVAKRNHSRRDDRKLGSVSNKLIQNCPAPVWVIKPEHPLHHKCVMAGTDLTPVGDLAAEFAAFIAEAENCELCIVHAWQVPMELQLSSARIGMEETERQKKEITSAARDHIRGLPAVERQGDRCKVYLACDSPSHAILELARQKEPDLAVLGSISRTGLAGMLVGNTAEKLLYQLDCSLLTIKPHDFVSPIQLEDNEFGQRPRERSHAN